MLAGGIEIRLKGELHAMCGGTWMSSSSSSKADLMDVPGIGDEITTRIQPIVSREDPEPVEVGEMCVRRGENHENFCCRVP